MRPSSHRLELAPLGQVAPAVLADDDMLRLLWLLGGLGAVDADRPFAEDVLLYEMDFLLASFAHHEITISYCCHCSLAQTRMRMTLLEGRKGIKAYSRER